MTQHLSAGSELPVLSVTTLQGESLQLGKARGDNNWQMVVIYRGKHCPLCTRYLNSLENYYSRLQKIGIDLVAVSGDSLAQLQEHSQQLNVSFTLAYGLTLTQMKQLGLYISEPLSPQETDHPFAEPALFIINSEGKIQVIDLANIPLVRPDLDTLLYGLEWLRDPNTHYPIRGTYAY